VVALVAICSCTKLTAKGLKNGAGGQKHIDSHDHQGAIQSLELGITRRRYNVIHCCSGIIFTTPAKSIIIT